MFVKLYYINLLWPHGPRHVLSFITLNIISVPALFHAGRCLEMVVVPPKESYQMSTTQIQQHGKEEALGHVGM
jgi:hypothetical protein